MNLQSLFLLALVLAVAAFIGWRWWLRRRRQADKCAACDAQGCIMKTQLMKRRGTCPPPRGPIS